MKLPLSWLREYVAVDDSPNRLADRLTFAGLEVEALETYGAGIDDVCVAEVLAIVAHPDADRLQVCSVYDGRAEYTVVCGADNFKDGDKVAFAGDGCRLPNGVCVRTARLRGVTSEGMLCAEDELGLSDDHTGIMILPPETRPGTPLAAAIGAPDTVLTIEVTPNRGDCLSIIGMAREVAAIYGLPLRWPRPEPVAGSPDISERLTVDVLDPEACPRYTARIVDGCRVGPSPQWMQRRLTLCGVRPINNIVDITNYVMLECGQPLHAFDCDRLKGTRLVVRRAKDKERLAMLDETCRTLESSMLVIANETDALAVAGVMGGETSGIDANTTSVVLESAAFTPTHVRQTARRLGVSTEASYRFERGVDPEWTEWASRRAATLLAEMAAGQCARGLIDVAAPRPAPRPIRVRPDRVRSVLGCDISDTKIDAILRALNFGVESGADQREYQVTPPSFRTDVSIEEDLIEEVARLHGLDKIPAPAPFARIVPEADDRPVRDAMRCRDRLAGMGLQEIMNYTFVSHKFLDIFMPDSAGERLVIPYPVSAEHAVMRPSLIPQMIETLGRNLSRQVVEAALFESGRVFRREPDGGWSEEDRLAIGLMGPVGRPPLDKQRPVDAQEIFLWLKGIAENLVIHQRVSPAQSIERTRLTPVLDQEPLTHSCFESGQAVSLSLGGQFLGTMGIVAGRIAVQWRCNTPIAVLEMALNPLLPPAEQTAPQLKPAPAFPSVRRDLAMILQQDISHQQIMAVIAKNAPPELTFVSPFDIFTGKGIGPGLKSLAYSFTYRADDRTLTDEEVNRMHQAIRDVVSKQLRVTLRE